MWASCYGALALAERSGIKPEPSNINAAMGTLTHKIAEHMLTCADAILPGAKHTIDGFEILVDDDRIERAQAYADAVRARGGAQFYEVRVRLDTVLLTEGESGTADAIVADLENHTLEVHDLKDGNGRVDAKDNDQLILYALGSLDEMNYLDTFQTVTVHIQQPRLGWHDEWTYALAELEGHRERLRYAARRNVELLDERTPMAKVVSALNPSDKACKWCPMMARGCPARAKQVADQFPDVSVTPSVLTPEQIGDYLTREKAITEWFSSLRGQALAAAKNGTTIPGWKLANGRAGPRAWIDADKAEETLYEVLEAKAYTKKVLSPTDAQKKLKAHPEIWEALQPNIQRSEGQPTLVPESDSRAPLSLNVPEFANLAEGEDLL